MEIYNPTQIIVREKTHTRLVETLAIIAMGGGHDQIGLGYWLQREDMRIVVAPLRFDTIGEMGDLDPTVPSNRLLDDVVVEFASLNDAQRFMEQWA